MALYREEMQDANIYKQTYLDGLEHLITQRQEMLAEKRKQSAESLFSDQADCRHALKKILGWPLVDCSNNPLPNVQATKLSDEDGYSVYRMQFEILDGFVLTGLYFRMNTEEKRPLVLVQHGGLGTPELISGFYGSTHNYNQILERVIAQGVHAFAPQFLLWDKTYGIPFDRVRMDARLKRVGSSIAAVELYCLVRILDYFETQEEVRNFGMVGLSYGGFYTLFMAAIDTRIRSAISCAFFNTRDRVPWPDWTWFRVAEQFDDAEIACLVYPRKLCIEIARDDDMFDFYHGVRAFEKLTELCKDVGTDWVTFFPFDGVHEFCKDDAPIKELAAHLLR